ncbi:hypothetical protein [Nocardioides convexus]|uniref:hypothetical protein n=1 Tax=Nocardioides convexus TaxID=2712224 RepID=UPI00241898FA|nr:hypothetical protein [Nocardioides convexus]
MTTTDTALAADIDATCRLTGEFTLRSGQVSNEYFDKYLFEADPQAPRPRGPRGRPGCSPVTPTCSAAWRWAASRSPPR